MTNWPLVSVIINAYNGERYVREAIDSVYRQTYPNWEIVFYDNASTDQTASIAQTYDKRLRYHHNPKNVCLGHARSNALALVNGDYVAYIDCDDRWHPSKLQRQVETMMVDQSSMCYTAYDFIRTDGKRYKTRKLFCQTGFLLNSLLQRYEVLMSSCMLKTSYLKDHQLSFHHKLRYAPDYLLFMLIAANERVSVIHESLLDYRTHGGQLTRALIDRIPLEYRYVLNCIRQAADPDKLSECALKQASIKGRYYHARSLLLQGKHAKAQMILSRIARFDWRYRMAFMASMLPTVMAMKVFLAVL